MSNVIALNSASKEEVEQAYKEAVERQFSDFVRTDPEARLVFLEGVKSAVSKMSAWDISYHGGFRDLAREILKQDDIKPLLQKAVESALGSEKDVNYAVYEAIGNAMAEKLKIEVSK